MGRYKTGRTVCELAGCTGEYFADGLCRLHYQRRYRTGTTDEPIRMQPGQKYTQQAGLTVKQMEALAYIRLRLSGEKSLSPSIEEIQKALKMKAKSGALRIVRSLQERGYITFIPYRPRTIMLVVSCCPHCNGALPNYLGINEADSLPTDAKQIALKQEISRLRGTDGKENGNRKVLQSG